MTLRVEPRRAGRGDVDTLVELRAEMFYAMGITNADDSWRARAREWFIARIDDPAYCLFVVEDTGQVVACAMGAIRDAAPSPSVPSGRDVLISNVCTAPESRGQGYGRAVFQAVMRWARQSGVSRAELMATEHGRTMYQRAGFVVTHLPAMRAPLT